MSDKEKLLPVDIEEEMKSSFLDYSMSVIISRALPDVRDGLKPVHRRILVTLRDLNLYHNRPFRKCAKIAGDVSGNYHPHGEAIVYPSLVRMAQDFSLRYPLIDGQGNFGSVDGDPPAAMRYTEARMTRIGGEMLQDIDKETVDYIPNYDGSRTEPTVLPSAIPNLLINGSSGIAVGMATNIPPHNLGEVVDGLIRLIKNPQTSIDELIQVIRAPDFPTGGYIYGIEGVKEAYLTGRGIIQIRARVMVEELKKGEKVSLIINEIPYQINKTNLLEKIAQLVKDKVLDDVADLRDESDREGMRIVLELKRGVNPDITLKKLYTHTQLQITFGIIMLAIANNQPKVFNLKELLQAFVEHRKEVLTRRTLFDLKKAEERLHILEGLKIALDHLDEVITLIRRSKAPEEAKKRLMSRYKLSAIQAQAILDIRLQRLTAMERSKILEERREVLRSIARFEELLASEQLIMNLIEEDLLRIKKEYGDKRRATIIEQTVEIDPEDMIPEEDMVITCTHSGYIKRTPVNLYHRQLRGGKGRMGIKPKEKDFVEHFFIASTHSYILVFTQRGRLFWLKVHRLPELGTAGKGKPIVNLLNIPEGEKIAALLAVKEFKKEAYILMATKKGMVKKTSLASFSNPRSPGIRALSIAEDDELLAAKVTEGKQDIFLGTSQGKAIRFRAAEVRPRGRGAGGVKCVTLRKDDWVVGMEIVGDKGESIFTITANGYGKRSQLEAYRRQKRGGKGLINVKSTDKRGSVIGVKWVDQKDEIMVITAKGKIIRVKVSGIRVMGRNTQGVRIIHLGEGDSVVGTAKIIED